MIRAARLWAAGIRWQSRFHWDDVAFHFECLVSGMTAKWMSSSNVPDSFYRLHAGERYGRVLHTPDGIRNSAAMLQWMYAVLRQRNQANEQRRKALARSFFRACLLRSIDAGEYRLAAEVLAAAAESMFLLPEEVTRLRLYRVGRACLRLSPRATYYWNRLAGRGLLPEFFSRKPSTYAKVEATTREARRSLQSLLGCALPPDAAAGGTPSSHSPGEHRAIGKDLKNGAKHA